MTFNILAAFWAVSFLFVITPGADWAYAISAGVRGRWVIPAVTGLLSGHLIATVVVAAGVGAVVSRSPLVLTALTIGGAAYLVWLGVNMIKHPSVPEQSHAGPDGSWLRWVIKGACVSGLNPKVFLLFLALLPQFTNPSFNWSLPTQIITLGLVHTLSCAVVYLFVSYGARAVLSARPNAAQWVSRISGGLMILIGFVLIGERLAG